MNQAIAAHMLKRFAEAQEALTSVRLKPWADELMLFVPRNRPEDFAHLVHFLEGLSAAFGHFHAFTASQGLHEEQDVADAIQALNRLAYDARLIWNEYKSRAAIAGRTDGYGG
jgi:hypothetical protein